MFDWSRVGARWQIGLLLAAVFGGALAVAQFFRPSAPQSRVLTMPICANREASYRLQVPPYAGEVRFELPPALSVVIQNPAEWPPGDPRNKDGSFVQSLLFSSDMLETTDLVGAHGFARGFPVHLWNLYANMPGKIDLITKAYARRDVAGRHKGLPLMRSGPPPPQRRAQPTAGFWVWDTPEEWYDPELRIHGQQDRYFEKIYQPLAAEDTVVIRCNYDRASPDLPAGCTAYTEYVVDPAYACSRIAFDYGFSSADLGRWAQVDAGARASLARLVKGVRFARTEAVPAERAASGPAATKPAGPAPPAGPGPSR